MGELLELRQPVAGQNAAIKLSCLLCSSPEVEQFLDLGHSALANRFLKPSELNRPEPVYPLRAGFCHGCGHVQLMDRVPPQEMFDNYLYISSASDTLKNHLGSLARLLIERHRLTARDLVVDIGSNDGTLLSGFAHRRIRTLGVDPAQNLAERARAAGVETCTAYFGAATAARIRERYGPATVITATNSFPHIPDLDDYLEGVHRLLAPDGVLLIEAHYLMDLLEQRAFDTVYHEHVSYWALGPAVRLFDNHGFQVIDAERLPLHHGQLRMWVQRTGTAAVRSSVGALLEQECASHMDTFQTYTQFAAATRLLKQDLRRALLQLKAGRKRIVAYGAPAKGTTLLSYLELGPALIDYIADRSPLKQGLCTPGSHIPIVAPERILEDQPDFVLILAWNFVDEIIGQLAEYRRRGGRFLLPVPEVRMI